MDSLYPLLNNNGYSGSQGSRDRFPPVSALFVRSLLVCQHQVRASAVLLGGVEVAVEARRGDERVVAPALDDAVLREHDDLVHLAHRGEAVGDDHGPSRGA